MKQGAVRVNRSISISDIARKVRLSESTISRALRGKGEISQETRDKVIAAAHKLGYRPNLHTKAIQSGMTHIVGIVGNIVVEPDFRGRVFEGIHDALLKEEYLAVVAYSTENVEGSDELSLIYRLIDHRIDGLIFFPSSKVLHSIRNVWDMKFPVVAVDLDPDVEGIDYVGTDDLLGGRLAARHLLSKGHRHFLYLTGMDVVEGSSSYWRAKGFEEEVTLVPGTDCISLQAANPGRGPRNTALIEKTLENRPEVTAVFAWNDVMASDLYAAARKLGLHIPGDLSVVGFGNLDIGYHLDPGLTTFEQFPGEIGARTAGVFLERIRGKKTGKSVKIQIPPELVERESVSVRA